MRKKLHPAWFQGSMKKVPHFEGWYFKITDKNEGRTFAIIPGVSLQKERSASHAFIQIVDSEMHETYIQRFPIDDFNYKNNAFEIAIERNTFSGHRLNLDFKKGAFELSGELTFRELTPWPKTPLSPGIMGWYTWVPFMECYHGILSLHHYLEGTLRCNGRKIDFSGGVGYAEKDWGQSFPEAYLWCQSNHFNEEKVSLTGSIAVIPWIKRPFLGVIFGLLHRDKIHRFTTYLGAKLTQLTIVENEVHLTLEQGEFMLRISSRGQGGSILEAPTPDGMTRRISETLDATIEVLLTTKNKQGERTIFHDTGRIAGFEIAGNGERLREMGRVKK